MAKREAAPTSVQDILHAYASLARKWEKELASFPADDENAQYAKTAVMMCMQELQGVTAAIRLGLAAQQ